MGGFWKDQVYSFLSSLGILVILVVFGAGTYMFTERDELFPCEKDAVDGCHDNRGCFIDGFINASNIFKATTGTNGTMLSPSEQAEEYTVAIGESARIHGRHNLIARDAACLYLSLTEINFRLEMLTERLLVMIVNWCAQERVDIYPSGVRGGFKTPYTCCEFTSIPEYGQFSMEES